jgi:hypothetical protein
MTKRRSTLTGSWSGAFRYPDDAFPETVFNAQIEENIAGAFVGSVQEPNIIRPHLSAIIDATLEGAREGSALNFIKYYNGNGGMGHLVTYDGVVDANFQRIDGKWSVPGSWSGTFFMERDDLGEEEAVEVKVEAPIQMRK